MAAIVPADAVRYRRHVEDIASVLGVSEVLGRPAKGLSGGTRRKLEIVRALMHEQRVLFLDEPTAGLDPESRRNLWSYLAEARQSYGTTVFLTTHYLEEAEPAETVCIIVNGRVLDVGSPAAIKRRHPVPEAARLAQPEASLEDAYLNLVKAGLDPIEAGPGHVADA